MEKQIHPKNVKGIISIPSSKSDAQRALIAASLAHGESSIYNYGKSDDEQNLLKVIEKMGAFVLQKEPTLEVMGMAKPQFTGNYSIGESGLAFRILMAIFSLNARHVELTGKGTLRKRSMSFFEEVLPQLGIEIKSNNGVLPFLLNGQLKGGEITVDGSQSSQYISGLLMALPLAKENSRLVVTNLNSKPYVKMTLHTMAQFGISIESKNFSEFLIHGNQHYLSTSYRVEGDWSSASFWMVAAALGAKIKVEGLSMSSLQADKEILAALMAAGCKVQFDADGIFVDGKERKAFQFDATHCPDLFPPLVTLAALTEGVSTIKGAKRLQNKESDRAKVLIKEFGKLGVKIIQEEDLLIIFGQQTIQGGSVSSHHDHRIAMSFGILGLFTETAITVQHADAVAKSYPDFWAHLEALSEE